MTRVVGSLSATAVLVLLVATAAAQDYAGRQVASVEFSTAKPASPMFQQISIDYQDPDDPEGQPPAVRKVETILQGGARYDTAAVARCTASDPQLMARGEAACPPEAKVGEGVTTIDSGVPGPGRFVTAQIDFFNNEDELIYVTTVEPAGAHTVIRAKVFKRRTVTPVGMLPGLHPDGGSVDTAEVELGRVDGDASYLTTPPRCPARGTWVNRIRFTYADGKTQETSNSLPCRKGRPS